MSEPDPEKFAQHYDSYHAGYVAGRNAEDYFAGFDKEKEDCEASDEDTYESGTDDVHLTPLYRKIGVIGGMIDIMILHLQEERIDEEMLLKIARRMRGFLELEF